jgi:hypothetical protein
MPFLLSLLLLSSVPAQAQQPLHLIQAALEDESDAPTIAVACGRIEQIQAGFQESAVANLAAVALESRLPMSSSGLQAREWIRLARAGGLSDLGLNVEGSVLLEFSIDQGESYTGQVPMSGSDEQIQTLMEQIFQDHLEVEGEGWRVRPWDPAVEEPWIANLVDTELGRDLIFRKSTAIQSTPAPTSILTDIESRDGCYVVLGMQERDPEEVSSALLALTDDPLAPILLRVETPIKLPPELQTSEVLPLGGSSIESPFAVLGLSISPYRFMELSLIRDQMDQKQTTSLQMLKGRVQLPEGTTLALFGTQKNPEPVLVAPVLNSRGRAFRPRHLNRLIGHALPDVAEYERLGPYSFRVLFDDKPVYGRVSKGVVTIGSDAARVDQAVDGLGDPWLTEEDLEWAHGWPITIKFRTPTAVPFMPSGFSGRAGLRGSDGRVDLVVQPEASMGTAAPALLAMGAAYAIPNFIEMQYRAKRGELTAHVSSIHQAMHESDGQEIPIEALPVAPRELSLINKDPVDWTAGPEWDALGWAPEAKVRASYWVVRLPDGSFEVHGQADIDGDGELCHWVQGQDETQPQMLTPNDVY